MGFRWGWWWKRGEGEGGPFWKRAPLPPRAPPSPPKTFIQVGMARPRRWAQGLSSPQTGKGAGEAGGERAPPVRQMPDRQQGTDDRGGFRGIFKREKWKTGRRGLLSAMQRHTKVAVGKQAGGGAGRIRCDAGSYGQRQEAATRQTLRTGCYPIHRKKTARQKAGRPASGSRFACRAGRQGPDEKVLERRGGPTEGGRRPCPLRHGSYGQG